MQIKRNNKLVELYDVVPHSVFSPGFFNFRMYFRTKNFPMLNMKIALIRYNAVAPPFITMSV